MIQAQLSNVALAVWLVTDAVRLFRLTGHVAELADTVLGAALLAQALFVLVRRPPRAVRNDGPTWVIVMTATLLPMLNLWVPPPTDLGSLSAVSLRWIGTAGMVTSTLYLRGNFSLLPQCRSLVTCGPYRLVRHPLYASYLILDMAFWLPGGSLLGGAVWCFEAVFLFWRARLEEACLGAAEATYAAYSVRVPYRFLPGVV